MSYSFSIKYKLGSKNQVADALSRLPSGPDASFDSKIKFENIIHQIHSISYDNMMIKAVDIAKATNECNTLKQVLNFTKFGWPSNFNKEINSVIQPYYKMRQSISTDKDILLNGDRVIIPKSLQSQILKIFIHHILG